MIGLYGAQAHGGNIISLDDQSVERDLADADGSGGNAYTSYVRSQPFMGAAWSTLRRLFQRVIHEGDVTITGTPIRDEQESVQTIERELAIGGDTWVTIPMAEHGTVFQVQVGVSDFDAPVEIGAGEVAIVPRRASR